MAPTAPHLPNHRPAERNPHHAALLDRLPPHDPAAELAVIGCMLRDNDTIDDLSQALTAAEFYSVTCGRAFTCLLALRGRPGGAADVVLLGDEMLARGWLTDAGGPPWLVEAADAAPTAVNAAHYAGIVRSKALLRAVARAGREAAEAALVPGADGPEVLRGLERAVFALAEPGAACGAVPLAEAVNEAIDRIDARLVAAGQGPPRMSGLPTGLHDLDAITAGLQRGDLAVIAARPSVGKTAIALAIARHACEEPGRRVLFCSIEQGRVALATRLLCAAAGIEGHLLRVGVPSDPDVRALTAVLPGLPALPLWIDDGGEQTVMRIASAARRLKRQGGLDLVVVDYLQLIASDLRREPRHAQVADISRRLKAAAKELQVPILALAQLNRDSEKRSDTRPRLADLRESAQIEQDADLVLLLHRDAGRPAQLEIAVAKQRDGPTGEISVAFDRARMRFGEAIPTTPWAD